MFLEMIWEPLVASGPELLGDAAFSQIKIYPLNLRDTMRDYNFN